MFEVFAVDPATVARSWDTFRGTVGRMGPDEGRLIADFPSAQGGQNWSTVVRAITRQLPDVERSRIMARLARVRAVGVTHRYARGKSWLENVITAHGRAAWHAVLTDDVACTLPVTLRPADAEDREGLFSVPHHAIVPREATAIVETLAPLLHVSRRLLLVDPHFMDQGIARWTPIPSALIEEARKGPAPLAETIVHTAVGRDRNGDVRHGRGEWRQRLHQELAPRLPRNVRVRVVRWDQVGKADPMHGRYVLTDLGGVQIDWGIDERIGGRTDVHRLTSAGWTERMNEFDPAFAGAPFDDVTVTAS